MYIQDITRRVEGGWLDAWWGCPVENLPGAGHLTAMEPTATTHPERRANMEGKTAFVTAMALIVLSSNMSRSTSSVA